MVAEQMSSHLDKGIHASHPTPREEFHMDQTFIVKCETIGTKKHTSNSA